MGGVFCEVSAGLSREGVTSPLAATPGAGSQHWLAQGQHQSLKASPARREGRKCRHVFLPTAPSPLILVGAGVGADLLASTLARYFPHPVPLDNLHHLSGLSFLLCGIR
jgi:hypothetical protein